eukprot:1161785-Pelagomonas_calceolata.AAC.12
MPAILLPPAQSPEKHRQAIAELAAVGDAKRTYCAQLSSQLMDNDRKLEMVVKVFRPSRQSMGSAVYWPGLDGWGGGMKGEQASQNTLSNVQHALENGSVDVTSGNTRG